MPNYNVCSAGPEPRGGEVGGLTPRKAFTKNYGSTFGCFGRLQSLIALKIRPLNMAMELKQLSIVMTAITLLYLLSGNCWIIK